MISVALTGRIGSGKSYITALFRELGVPTLDLDGVGRSLQQQPEVVTQLANALGHQIMHNGVLNRAQLAAICFADSSKMQLLETIMHPLIWQHAKRWRNQQHTPYGIIEASALRKHHPDINYIITIAASKAVRRQRVMARGKQSENDFTRIDRLQHPPLGDFIIENNGDKRALHHRVYTLHTSLLKLIVTIQPDILRHSSLSDLRSDR